MMDRLPSHIPIELMEILTKINDNINEVKERMARIEAQDHTNNIKTVWDEIEKERNKRIELQLEIATIRTKLAPVIVGITLAGSAILNFLLKYHN